MTLPAKISILGFGRTGRALVQTLAGKTELFLSEARSLSPEEKAFLEEHCVAFEEGGHSEACLQTELLVPSPGVPPHTPVLQEALRRGVPICSEIELAYRLARPKYILAVTGTNGKSTTTELIAAILGAWGFSPVVAGNIGRPAVETVEEVTDRPWVLEVSSFQLLWTGKFRAQVAVWLNFAPDHLDYHGSLAHYFATKAKLLARQNPEDYAVLGREILASVSPRAKTRVIEEVELPPGWGEEVPEHVRYDLQAAWAACSALDSARDPPPYEVLRSALRQPHRLEWVGEMGGIPFVDDSKGTNAHATCAALRAMSGKVVLILGGRHKRGGYGALEPLVRQKVRACVLIGESQDFFAELLSGWDIPFARASDPLDALRKAYALARPGDTVLLSPACASFDQFRDYAHRGEAFNMAFQRLREEAPAVR